MNAFVKSALDFFSRRAQKAWAAGVAAGLAALLVAVADGQISPAELQQIVGAALAAAVLVFWVPNAKPAA